jgi:hypothetical protein
MNKLSLIFTACIILTACTKEKNFVATGTVINNLGCFANTSMVEIDNPDPAKFSFICNENQPGLNCKNAVFIMNMPAHLAVPGKKVTFSIWKDMGLQCLSSSYGAHHLEVMDIKEQ